MRNRTTHKTAASVSPLPFDGLGMDMESVSLAAEAMTVTHLTGIAWTVDSRVGESFAQPSGYSLLVALGREIRGR